MKLYAGMILFLFCGYYIQAADLSLPLNKTEQLKLLLQDFKVKANSAGRTIWVGDQKARKKAAFNMHAAEIVFVFAVYELGLPKSISLTGQDISDNKNFCIKELKKRPESPRSADAVKGFFDYKENLAKQAEELDRQAFEAEKIAYTIGSIQF